MLCLHIFWRFTQFIDWLYMLDWIQERGIGWERGGEIHKDPSRTKSRNPIDAWSCKIYFWEILIQLQDALWIQLLDALWIQLQDAICSQLQDALWIQLLDALWIQLPDAHWIQLIDALWRPLQPVTICTLETCSCSY